MLVPNYKFFTNTPYSVALLTGALQITYCVQYGLRRSTDKAWLIWNRKVATDNHDQGGIQ